MNEFIKKMLARITTLWAGWAAQQKVIAVVIVVVLIGVIVALFSVSSSPVLAKVYDRAINNEEMLDSIVRRINQENVEVTVTNGIVQVKDAETARRMRVILLRENLLPQGINPWQIFDKESWTITDMERNVNFQRAQERMIADHIRAIDGVDNVEIRVVWPKRELFLSDQKPVSASVTIIPTPGSDITQNRYKVEGVQKILQFAIEGLTSEHIVITDNHGIVLNDFEGMAAADRLALIEQETKLIRKQESHYRDVVLASLQKIYSPDRVRDLNIKIGMDLSKKSIDTREHFPIMIKEQTPGLPYDDSIRRETLLIGEAVAETNFRGSGITPEGPPGVEGHIPPAYMDMDNLYGEMTHSSKTHNYEVNRRDIKEERSPSIDRVTVSVNIDGTWKWKYDEKGKPIITADNTIEREYTEVPPEEINRVAGLIRDAIGYNAARGDSVTVHNIKIDRSAEFKVEDDKYFKQKQMQLTVIAFISGLTFLLFGFMLFRMISREMERRRRIAEEERARREQMMRESAMAEAEDGTEVSISYEERSRMELMENAINLAKEHPEDAAQLIRTWLLEE